MLKSKVLPIMLSAALCGLGATLFGCSQSETSTDTNAGSQASSSSASSSSASSSTVNSEANRDLAFEDIPDDALIDTTQLNDALASADAPFVLDVRSAGTYSRAFIPGSKNIPAGRQIDLRINEIPDDKTIVLIGRGTERLAEVRQTLIDAGFDPASIKVDADGIEGWQAAGLPTDEREAKGC